MSTYDNDDVDQAYHITTKHDNSLNTGDSSYYTKDEKKPLLNKSIKQSSILNTAKSEIWSFIRRFTVLVALMLLQSGSSFILGSFQQLLESHVIIALFLTMLVGAGGNAGNQSAVLIIRSIATGEIKKKGVFKIIFKEFLIGLFLSLFLGVVAYARVLLQRGEYNYEGFIASFAITLSLILIVFSSVIIGALLPLMFQMIKLDPAHAGPTIQVVMDMIGVLITLIICKWILGDTEPTNILMK